MLARQPASQLQADSCLPRPGPAAHLHHDLAGVESDLDELVQDGVEHRDTKPGGGHGGQQQIAELQRQQLQGGRRGPGRDT